MADRASLSESNWRQELPALSGRLVILREPLPHDLAALVELLRLADASRFGIDGPVNDAAMLALMERVVLERRAGTGFAFTIMLQTSPDLVGLARVRQLDLGFEAAEWEITLAPVARGEGAFLETAGLVGSFAFHTVGARRLEARVSIENGRASTALRKLGAVEEGVLRRSLRRGSDYVDQVLWSVLKEEWGHRRVAAPLSTEVVTRDR